MEISFEKLANELNINPSVLINESIKLYLHQQLIKIESGIFDIAQKYGIKSIIDLDQKIREGSLNEEIAYEDYFKLDNLEANKELITNALRGID